MLIGAELFYKKPVNFLKDTSSKSRQGESAGDFGRTRTRFRLGVSAEEKVEKTYDLCNRKINHFSVIER